MKYSTLRKIVLEELESVLNEANFQVITTNYKFVHGKEPRGVGQWAFGLTNKGGGMKVIDDVDIWWAPGMRKFSDALKAAKIEAKRRGASVIYVMP